MCFRVSHSVFSHFGPRPKGREPRGQNIILFFTLIPRSHIFLGYSGKIKNSPKMLTIYKKDYIIQSLIRDKKKRKTGGEKIYFGVKKLLLFLMTAFLILGGLSYMSITSHPGDWTVSAWFEKVLSWSEAP